MCIYGSSTVATTQGDILIYLWQATQLIVIPSRFWQVLRQALKGINLLSCS